MTIFSVATFLEKNNLILAVSRKGTTNDFGMPGGKVDPGETPEQAAIRELAEETGLITTLDQIEPVFDRPEETAQDRVCRVFRIKSWQGNPQSMEGTVVAWIPPEQFLAGHCSFREYNMACFESLGMII